MAPPNDGCSLFLRDLDELQKYARGRGRCQITIAAGRWARRARRLHDGIPHASPWRNLYESKLCAEIEDISYFETMQTVLIS